MKRILLVVVALLVALSMISCGRVSQKQVEKMIEDAVEDALEEQAEEADKDTGDEKAEEEKDEKEEADDKDDGDSGSLAMGFNYVGEEIPEDFPSKAIPLYESGDATVVAAAKASAGEDVTFQVGIGTDNKVKDVADDVKEALQKLYSGNELQIIEAGDMYMYVVTSKDWVCTVNVIDGQEEGFETLVTYALMSN